MSGIDGSGPNLFVPGHVEVYTEERGLVAIKVNVHEYEDDPNRPWQGHQVVFHPTDEGWKLRNHMLTAPDGVRVPQNRPTVIRSNRGYKTLYEAFEQAVAWMERNGYEVLTEGLEE